MADKEKLDELRKQIEDAFQKAAGQMRRNLECNLEVWKTRVSGSAALSTMARKINAWKSFAAEEGGK